MRPSRTAARAGSASVSASTHHWSVSIGSMTTLERSPNGWVIGLASTRGTGEPVRSVGGDGEALGGDVGDDGRARVVAVEAAVLVGHEVQGVDLGLARGGAAAISRARATASA